MTANLTGDVDVLWFDRRAASEANDRAIEARLQTVVSGVEWSVRNQARMHLRNGDPAYTSTENAMRFWPETATAIAVRRTDADECDIIAPFGLDDLLELKLRAAGTFAKRKRSIFNRRVRDKGWLVQFPKLHLAN